MYTDIHLHQGLFHDHSSCHLLYTCATPATSCIMPPSPSDPSGSQRQQWTLSVSPPSIAGMAVGGLPSPVSSQPWCRHPPNLPSSKQGAHSLPAWQRRHLAQGWTVWIKAGETFKHVPKQVAKQPKKEGTLGRERVTPSKDQWEDRLLASHQSQQRVRKTLVQQEMQARPCGLQCCLLEETQSPWATEGPQRGGR